LPYRRSLSPAALRRLRTERGLSQYQLCVRAGLSGAVVARIERGEVHGPAVWVVARLADALNVPLEDLFDKEPMAS
jgi:transcriptional regulator with XRE-family HTH domain